MFTFNYEKLEASEIYNEDCDELLYDINNAIDFLTTHNKNYTAKQYIKILEIAEFIKCIETI